MSLAILHTGPDSARASHKQGHKLDILYIKLQLHQVQGFC